MRRYRVSTGHASIKDVTVSDRCTVKVDRERMATMRGPSRYRDGSLPTVWVTLPWSEVEIDSVSWSAVQPDKRGGWIVPRNMQWGDYAGSTYDRSNYRVFCETFADDRTRKDGKPNWLEIYGGHGSHGIAVALSWYLSPAGASVRDFLNGLEEYALADDDDHSALEMELEHEAWTDYACSDLLRECSKAASGMDREDLESAFDSDALSEVWPHVLASNLGHCGTEGVFSKTYERHPPHCEGADSCHWPVDDYAEACTEEDLETLVREAQDMLATWQANGAHACLGCREASAQERLFSHGGYECHYPGCIDATVAIFVGPGLASTTIESETEIQMVVMSERVSS